MKRHAALLVKSILILIATSLLIVSCENKKADNTDENKADYIHRWMSKLHSAVVRDGFAPPLAARIYSYANIAAYEAIVPSNPEFISLAGQINGLENVPQPPKDVEIDFALASMIAFSTAGTAVIFSEDTLRFFEEKFLEEMKDDGMDQELIDASVNFGREVGTAIIEYAKKDNYVQSRTMADYTLTKEPGRWEPTPPDYMQAFEPYWNTIRPFALDSASQFKPVERPVPFDSTEGSPFWNQMMEVYNTVQNRTPEQETIARYWDDNPAVSINEGHVSVVSRKLTPPGHWMWMTGQACRKSKLDLIHSVEAYVLVAMSLHDGVISCWDEKYRSQYVRPVTVINQYVDEAWSPILQTPPFPEYTSGHSCFSGAASTTLTNLFGDNYSFTDSSELKFGMKTREFKSFNAAADEAAMSRLYGGIHFVPANVNGIAQGRKVATHLLDNVKTRKK